ncbi:hypothetical protein [Nitrospira moscoviensis]|uniref:Uncharacterized protein n=1 Tax=Nitrospira moscoviensis TaxID=42253 RepID=A0A0K2GC31_NITMO|nr:hypothetical protein [Nitrospira moscoviensis]ALA58510.1 hypothetical protein NITMOv2_2093 [Nitrospira moscoviensis]
MPLVGTSSSGQFSCASAAQHTLKDLKTKRKGQPVFVLGHLLERKGQEATFEVFNDRIALVKFSDGAIVGYDPMELLLPTEIDEQGVPYFEIRRCGGCDVLFSLTREESDADQEPTRCPDCR